MVQSIGINTKGALYANGYKNSSLIINSLNYIGVTQVRDAIAGQAQGAPVLHAMAAAGIQFNFMTSYGVAANGAAGIADFLSALKSFQTSNPGALLSIEGLNEADLTSASYNGLTSLEAAAAFQKDLYTAIKADPALSATTVLNLNLGYDNTSNYARIGDLGAYSDAANAHIYTHTGRANNDPVMESIVSHAKSASSGDPLIVTEMGHTTLQSFQGIGTNEAAQAKMMLTDLFMAFEDGASAVYLYELLDNSDSLYRGESEVYFGIFKEDGTPKLAATALHNLTTILKFGADGVADGTVPAVPTLSNAPSTAHLMTLDKPGAVYDILIWNDTPVWNQNTQKDITPVTTQTVLQFSQVESVIRVYDPLSGLEPIATYNNVSSISLPLSDHPLVVEVGAAAAVTETALVSNANLSLTAAQLMARIDSLAASSGLTSITLTDSHALPVSTVETMNYMISNYGSTLAKIAGGYSFTVSYGENNWETVKEYDAQGTLTLKTDYGYSNGDLVTKTTLHPDGTADVYSYKITGQTYTSLHQVSDASGKITLIERMHADGTFDSRELHNTDGSNEYYTYDTAGRLIKNSVTAQDGTITASNYDTAGKLIWQGIKEVDGDLTSTNYSAGVKTSTTITSHEGWTDTFNYLPDGSLSSDYRKNADGSVVSTTYVNGAVKTKSIQSVDGSIDNMTYGITGKTYTTEHSQTNASGKITLVERMHADGTFDTRELHNSDGSNEYYVYDTDGRLSQSSVTAQDGTVTASKYDTAGKLTWQGVKETDGDLTTTTYSAGVKTSTTITSHEGWTEQMNYLSDGTLSSDYRKNADGSSVTTTYSNGVVKTKAFVAADSSIDYTVYGITGKTYTIEHSKIDTSGKTTLIERMHDDGTFDYRELRNADGTKQTLTYTATGILTADTFYNTDGSRIWKSYKQDGTGDIQTEVFNAAGTSMKRDILHTSGKHDLYAFVDGQTLSGGAADDTFRFSTTKNATMIYQGGNDILYGFNTDGGAADHVAINKSWAADFASLNMVQQGSDVLIRFDAADTLLVKQQKVAALTSDYFIFS
ncbi:hypothetical protein BJF92_07680 [Rhizobium rhizosphaerae]|uniref:RHS repeat protein n=2 Tax=Xaviernesmea rhizosphaerae TaxID=1672749 RepID=A0A1Q9ACW8_9HYPH|nr:hypothetical protein BJF92_07680 [Xaviernesmea rhizosphaerae]